MRICITANLRGQRQCKLAQSNIQTHLRKTQDKGQNAGPLSFFVDLTLLPDSSKEEDKTGNAPVLPLMPPERVWQRRWKRCFFDLHFKVLQFKVINKITIKLLTKQGQGSIMRDIKVRLRFYYVSRNERMDKSILFWLSGLFL